MKNFNPRSHERSDTDKLNSLGFDFISIHAPTRGATRTDRDQQSGSKRFQSTLPREERRSSAICCDPRTYFNPRSHERSDWNGLKEYISNILFQSTLPREERQRLRISQGIAMYFNPRSHERSDKRKGFIMDFGLYFNPRSHERSDGMVCLFRALVYEFQSTLPREERRHGSH